MSNPGRIFRNIVGTFRDKPEADAPTADDGTGSGRLRPDSPTGAPNPHHTPIPAMPRSIAGLTERQRGEPVSRDAEPKGVVQSKCNDTHYMARNQVVRYVQYHFAKYGEQVSSAVLAKLLLPNGLKLILQRLEIAETGNAENDHKSILDFVERHGIEQFCARLKIRTSGTFPKVEADAPSQAPSPTPSSSSTRNPRAAVNRPPEKPRASMNSSPNVDRSIIKPVSLSEAAGWSDESKDPSKS